MANIIAFGSAGSAVTIVPSGDTLPSYPRLGEFYLDENFDPPVLRQWIGTGDVLSAPGPEPNVFSGASITDAEALLNAPRFGPILFTDTASGISVPDATNEIGWSTTVDDTYVDIYGTADYTNIKVNLSIGDSIALVDTDTHYIQGVINAFDDDNNRIYVDAWIHEGTGPYPVGTTIDIRSFDPTWLASYIADESLYVTLEETTTNTSELRIHKSGSWVVPSSIDFAVVPFSEEGLIRIAASSTLPTAAGTAGDTLTYTWSVDANAPSGVSASGTNLRIPKSGDYVGVLGRAWVDSSNFGDLFIPKGWTSYYDIQASNTQHFRIDPTNYGATDQTIDLKSSGGTLPANTNVELFLVKAASEGAPGASIKGDKGDKGDSGDGGWSPVLAVATDGDRRVLQVADWVGGAGTKPTTGQYVGPSGLVTDIADGVNIRGDSSASGNVGGNPVVSGSVSGNTLTLTLTDGTTIDIDVSTLAGGGGNPVTSGSVSGNTLTLTLQSGATIDIDVSTLNVNTTYSVATSSQSGLMSASDKAKLDGIASGATANTGTVTDVIAGTGLSRTTSNNDITLSVSNPLPKSMDTPGASNAGQFIQYDSTNDKLVFTAVSSGGTTTNNYYQLEPEPVASNSDIPSSPTDNDSILATAAITNLTATFVDNNGGAVSSLAIGDVALWDNDNSRWVIKGNIRGPAGTPGGGAQLGDDVITPAMLQADSEAQQEAFRTRLSAAEDALVTQSEKGLMSAQDKQNLDNLETSSTKFDLSTNANTSEDWRLPVDEIDDEYNVRFYEDPLGAFQSTTADSDSFLPQIVDGVEWNPSTVPDANIRDRLIIYASDSSTFSIQRMEVNGTWHDMTQATTSFGVNVLRSTGTVSSNPFSTTDLNQLAFDKSTDGTDLVSGGAKLLSATPAKILEKGVSGTPTDQQVVSWSANNARAEWATVSGGTSPDPGTSFTPSKTNLYSAVKEIFHPGDSTGISPDDTNSELDIANTFAPTKANLYSAVKEILHPANQTGVTADDTNNEIDISAFGFPSTEVGGNNDLDFIVGEYTHSGSGVLATFSPYIQGTTFVNWQLASGSAPGSWASIIEDVKVFAVGGGNDFSSAFVQVNFNRTWLESLTSKKPVAILMGTAADSLTRITLTLGSINTNPNYIYYSSGDVNNFNTLTGINDYSAANNPTDTSYVTVEYSDGTFQNESTDTTESLAYISMGTLTSRVADGMGFNDLKATIDNINAEGSELTSSSDAMHFRGWKLNTNSWNTGRGGYWGFGLVNTTGEADSPIDSAVYITFQPITTWQTDSSLKDLLDSCVEAGKAGIPYEISGQFKNNTATEAVDHYIGDFIYEFDPGGVNGAGEACVDLQNSDPIVIWTTGTNPIFESTTAGDIVTAQKRNGVGQHAIVSGPPTKSQPDPDNLTVYEYRWNSWSHQTYTNLNSPGGFPSGGETVEIHVTLTDYDNSFRFWSAGPVTKTGDTPPDSVYAVRVNDSTSDIQVLDPTDKEIDTSDVFTMYVSAEIGASHPTSFEALSDTPVSMTGYAENLVKVNTAETSLIFSKLPWIIGSSEPSSAIDGQPWYDSANNLLKIYSGTTWQEVGGSGSSTNWVPAKPANSTTSVLDVDSSGNATWRDYELPPVPAGDTDSKDYVVQIASDGAATWAESVARVSDITSPISDESAGDFVLASNTDSYDVEGFVSYNNSWQIAISTNPRFGFIQHPSAPSTNDNYEAAVGIAFQVETSGGTSSPLKEVLEEAETLTNKGVSFQLTLHGQYNDEEWGYTARKVGKESATNTFFCLNGGQAYQLGFGASPPPYGATYNITAKLEYILHVENARGPLWATSAALPITQYSIGTWYNLAWTISSDAPSSVTDSGIGNLDLPTTAPDGVDGFWVDATVAGEDIDRVFIPWGYPHDISISLNSTGSQYVNITRAAWSPGVQYQIGVESGGTTVPAGSILLFGASQLPSEGQVYSNDTLDGTGEPGNLLRIPEDSIGKTLLNGPTASSRGFLRLGTTDAAEALDSRTAKNIVVSDAWEGTDSGWSNYNFVRREPSGDLGNYFASANQERLSFGVGCIGAVSTHATTTSGGISLAYPQGILRIFGVSVSSPAFGATAYAIGWTDSVAQKYGSFNNYAVGGGENRILINAATYSYGDLLGEIVPIHVIVYGRTTLVTRNINGTVVGYNNGNIVITNNEPVWYRWRNTTGNNRLWTAWTASSSGNVTLTGFNTSNFYEFELCWNPNENTSRMYRIQPALAP